MSTTLNAALAQHATARPHAVAVQHKRLGLWHSVTWSQLHVQVAHTAAGLSRLGVGPGTAVGLVAEASPGWVVAELAALHLGARVVAVPPQLPWPTTAELLAGAAVQVVIAGDQEQVDLVAAHRDPLGAVEVVVIDPRGIGARLPTLASLQDVGAGAPQAAAVAGSVTLFDEGTADGPAPFTHSEHSLAALARSAAEHLELRPQDRCLLVLPPATPTARLLDIYAALVVGARIVVPESPATVAADLAEVEPTSLTCSPRVVQLLRLGHQRRTRESSRLRRTIIGWGMRRLTADGGAATGTGPSALGLPTLLVGLGVRHKLGLRRLRRLVLVDSATSALDIGFLRALRIDVRQVMGDAALGGAALMSAGPGVGVLAGEPLPAVDVQVDDEGQLWVRGPVTAEAPLATGSLVEVAGDRMIRLGRAAQRIEVGGRPVSAAALERAAMACPFVLRCVATGGADAAELTVEPEPTGVAAWAVDHGVPFSTYRSLVTEPRVVAAIVEQVRARLAADPGLPPVRGVVVRDRPWSTARGELTSTLDPRRDATVRLDRV